ncbi:hypothetical protein PYW07_011249 [Mythimna separata]|uniref:Fatty acyl-CoA reductase n=1 Tax=Mythimna separata TaxID=271217 RepID=A0AAD7Y904_MYTSE|nr:hypothetical protein PYW07_011249 [Mythimna separata]
MCWSPTSSSSRSSSGETEHASTATERDSRCAGVLLGQRRAADGRLRLPRQAARREALQVRQSMLLLRQRGTADVLESYWDSAVLLTGGSGFLGKQLVEKLFREGQQMCWSPTSSSSRSSSGETEHASTATERDSRCAGVLLGQRRAADGRLRLPRQAARREALQVRQSMLLLRQRGTADVLESYWDSAVLLTGGSGFLGKQLVEKLFRSCDINKVYLLMRPKRGKTIQQRLAYILKDPLYDTLRQKKPDFASRIVPVEGDVAELRLGLADKDWDNITKEVNIIVHMAATVNFQEPLHVAGITNVRGTRELLELGKQCHNLKLFNHVSTAFAHATVSRIDSDVKEQFYPCPVPPDVFLDMIASMDKERLTGITPALIKDWPNTYTFTKAIAEELVRTSAGDLPVCIVKPPVVTSSLVEPSPGWIDSQTIMSSVIGLIYGAGMGVLHVMGGDRNLEVSFAPVDYVNNAVIAAGWDSVQNRQLWGGDIPIYTVSSSRSGIKWGSFAANMQTDEFYRLSTPKSLWYCYVIETNNLVVYWLATWFLHYIPGYFLDALVSLLGGRSKGIPSLVRIYSRIDSMYHVYRYFLSNYWNFRDDNLQAMIARLSPADKAIYSCDIAQMQTKEFLKAASVGVRRFIIKDGLVNSEAAYRKQMRLYYANIVFISLYLYCIWKLIALVFSVVAVFFSV